jgi:LytS/YehU family sensor histidine kinase
MFIKNFSFNLLICLAMDIGHTYLIHKLDAKFSWIETPFKRLVAGLLIMGGYSFLVGFFFILIFYLFVFEKIDVNNIDWDSVIQGATIPVYISAFIITIFTSWSFLKSWKQAAIDSEKLKRESIQAQYDSLKNQINPHFLFNSFNVLTDLVYIDQDKAAQFIQQLSDVFRYVLETSKKELVPIKTEVEFLKSYIFLVKMRFGDNLIIEVPDYKDQQELIIPLCLQMLIENAIKHNIISSDEPLKVEVKIENSRISVKNNLQRKNLVEISTGIGLSNIIARYEHLKGEKVTIEETKDYFEVSVPLLNANI